MLVFHFQFEKVKVVSSRHQNGAARSRPGRSAPFHVLYIYIRPIFGPKVVVVQPLYDASSLYTVITTHKTYRHKPNVHTCVSWSLEKRNEI
jgi:hypothetical protein